MDPHLANRVSLEALFAASSLRTGPMFDFQATIPSPMGGLLLSNVLSKVKGGVVEEIPGLLGQTDVQLDQHLVGITSRVCTVLRMCLRHILWL